LILDEAGYLALDATARERRWLAGEAESDFLATLLESRHCAGERGAPRRAFARHGQLSTETDGEDCLAAPLTDELFCTGGQQQQETER
jgi:hypothetical protein